MFHHFLNRPFLFVVSLWAHVFTQSNRQLFHPRGVALLCSMGVCYATRRSPVSPEFLSRPTESMRPLSISASFGSFVDSGCGEAWRLCLSGLWPTASR